MSEQENVHIPEPQQPQEEVIPQEAANSQEAVAPQEAVTWQKSLAMYLHDLVYLLCVCMVTLLLVFRVVIVSGSSMYDTLVDGDYLILLSNTFYHNPEQGDIVVLSKRSFDNGTPIVKRVIATEGQTVDIDFAAGIVYVDGVALEEPYIYSPTDVNGGTQFPLTVADGCIFVLGDNRGVSRDSRYPEIGMVDKREILGKAIFLLVPGTHYDQLTRDFGRMGMIE